MTKKGLIFMCLALLMGVLITHAESISVTNLTIEPGQTGNVSISLNNTATNLVSFQMDLTLPEGVAINKSGCTLSSRFTDGDQELTIGKQGDNVYRLTSTSFAMTPLSGTSGEIITLSLSASESATGGTATLSNIRFVTSNSERVTLDDATFSISVSSPSPIIVFADSNVKALCVDPATNWDTNGDGELSMTEAAAVTSLGSVFRSKTNITSFDELQYFTGLRTIGDKSFASCTSLTSVFIPESVTAIGEYAFRDCGSLVKAEFASIESLCNINFQGSLSNPLCLASHLFLQGEEITNLVIPESVSSIGNFAFYNCAYITSIRITQNVTSIGSYTFGGCSGVSSIIVDDDNRIFDSRNNCNAIINTSANNLIQGCKNTLIPENVTSIGNNAFFFCENLVSIIIPESVTNIGEDAFCGCHSLRNITIPESVTIIGKNAFMSCHNLCSVKIPSEVTSIADQTFLECYRMESIVIPDNVVSIGEGAFNDCRGLTSIVIPQSVTEIKHAAFVGCSALVSVTMMNAIPVSISSVTFSNRSNATLYVPAGCKAAYENADYWKEFNQIVEMGTAPINNVAGNLSNVVGTDVTELKITGELNGTDILYLRTLINDYSLTSLDLSDARIVEGGEAYTNVEGTDYYTANDEFGGYMFGYCSNLTSIVLPSSITSIGPWAMRGTGISTITIPASVVSLDNNSAFEGCTSLEEIIVEDGNERYYSVDGVVFTEWAEWIGEGAKAIVMFPQGRSGSYNIPNDVTVVSPRAFVSADKLTSVSIPEGVTYIGECSFHGCSSITSIVLPSSLTSIEGGAFNVCPSLTSVVANMEEPCEISDISFENQEQIILHVPTGSKAAYKAADCWKLFRLILEEGDDIQLMGQPWEAHYQFVENWENATDPVDGNGNLWYSPNFDDSEWDYPLTGPLDNSNWETEYSAYYLRRTFNLSEVKDGYYLIHANHDDHVKVYLNGTLVGVKEGSGTHDLFIPSSLLQVGENILAIYIDDNGGVDRCLDYDFRYIGDGSGPDIYVDEQGVVYQREDNNYSVRGYVGESSSIVIPEELFELPVTSIGASAFADSGSLVSVCIPESVTSIGHSAFIRCSSLSAVNIPDGVTFIDDWAFQCCALSSITIPASVTGIGVGAFNQCPLTVVTTNMAEPCEIADWTFTSRTSAVLIVPAGSKEAYENADFWKEFKEIREEGDEIHLMGQSWEARYQFFENWEEVTDPTDGTDNPWYSPNFDDSGWPTLTGPLDNNNWDAEFSAYYLRQTFTLDNVKEGYYSLTVRHDDLVSVYLNGTFVGAKDYGTHEFIIPSNLLVVGNNLLAFYIDDRGGDRGLDYELFYLGNNNTGIYIDEQGVVYKRNENSYYVKGTLYNFDATSVVIPEELFDLPVTSIGHSAFTSGCGNLQSITIPESVISIEDWAFRWCGSLTSVTIPASVTSIGVGAFSDCNLTMVTVESDTPTMINNEQTFSNRSNAVLYVPVGSKAAYEAADYWKDFKAILEEGEDPIILQYGADQAWSMKYVFNESCENVQEPANDSDDNPWYAEAYNDEAWESLTGPMAREGDTFGQVNYTWETPGSCYFLRRTFQMESIIDGFYELLGICDDNMDAYVNGQKLVKENRGENFHWLFRIPSTLLHEGNNTLALFIMDNGGGDAYLDYSMSFAETPKTIAFADADVKAICVANWDTNGDGELSTLEAASVGDLSSCFMNNEESVLETFDSFDELQYFTGLSSLNPWVFYNCKNLSSIIIPASVTSIEIGALQFCSALTSITIPESVTSIGESAFASSGLTSITISESVTTIGKEAFCDCSSLTSITIPSSVTSIGDNAFFGCVNLESVSIPNSVTSISSSAFRKCWLLTSFTFNSAEEALTKVDDVYQIGTAEDLHNFAILTTAASSSLNACLTADIDYTGYTGSCNGGNFYPIGLNGYRGTFDGQGHTITLNIEDSHYSDQVDEAGNAMFLSLREGGVIRNLRTSGTIESSCRFSAGILSYLADGTVSHCVSDVDIISNIEGDCTDGGIVALGNMSGDSPGLVEYCVFAGSFQGESATHRGGIVGVGYSGNSSNITLDNCLFIAATDNLSVDGSDTFIREPNESTTISNCYYLNTLGDASAGTPTTSEQLASGELCYLLNGESSESPNWYQTLGEDGYPVPFNTHGTVYKQEGIYTNTPIEFTDISEMENVIYIEPTEARCGEEKVLSIKMKNNVAIQTIQFDLYLPDGLTVVRNEDNELMTASKERISKFSSFDSAVQEDGSIRVLAQATNTNIAVGDGEIATIKISLPEDMESGEYSVKFQNTTLVELDNTSHSPEPDLVQSKLTVYSFILGDANGDKKVDAVDFNMIANDILGYHQDGFNRAAADINGDKKVDAIDFNMIANKILYGSFSGEQGSKKNKGKTKETESEDSKEPM